MKISWFILFREIIAVYSWNLTKPNKQINTLHRQNVELLNVEEGDIVGDHDALKA
jgi:hypothetical protein